MKKVWHGEFYYLSSNQHIKNERIFFAKGCQTIGKGCKGGDEGTQAQDHPNEVFFSHHDTSTRLSHGGLLYNATLPHVDECGGNPQKTLKELVGWDFVHTMSKVCSNRLKADLIKAKFILVNADEVTSMDNS
jgi:hypothetical protein